MSATRTTRRCTTTWRSPARIGRGSGAGDRRSARESASRPTTPATSRGGARRGRAAPATGWARARRRRVFLACDHDVPFTWRAARRRAPAGALAYIACRFSARAIVCIAVSVHSNRVLACRRARAGACGPVRACQRVRACVRVPVCMFGHTPRRDVRFAAHTRAREVPCSCYHLKLFYHSL